MVVGLRDGPVSSLSHAALSQGQGGQGQTAALYVGPPETQTEQGGDLTYMGNWRR